MALASRLSRPFAAGTVKRAASAASGTTYKKSIVRFPRTFTTSSRLFTDQATASIPPIAQKSILRRTLGFFSIAFFFTTLGVAVYIPSMVASAKEIAKGPPTDEETLTMYVPADDVEREIEEHIRNHPVAVELRSRPEMSESRPHMKIPFGYKAHNFTGGTLMGPGRVAVPPFAWNEAGGKSMVSISYLGEDLCGHPGIIHGGMLATMLDEGLARCCFAALPNKIGMTANLNINYRAPAPAGSFVVLRAETTKVEGRKAWVKGHIETLVGEGETPVILVEATALFIEPKLAAI
ncbi:putative UPF0644 protein PB2B4.06 [Glarea lozoyensis 74030]|uniref:Putative UPF0644 protein PB2B4.06 n=1 Tax=Glarea lozoyensis (strain ATCC 74030 / MF5533) TaxID=1104152 RepID=H0EKP4_GLAL7|nr:putative UPF0644 protein PB2B4.06 [Glarea lozoyensis 74030]